MRSINPIQIISKAAGIRIAIPFARGKTNALTLKKPETTKGPMSNLAIPENCPGIDNPWWSEPAFAHNLFEANKTVPNNTWSAILNNSSKKKISAQARITKWLEMTSLM